MAATSGILLVIATQVLQHACWKNQQRFLAEQRQLQQSVERANLAQETLTDLAGRRITASVEIVAAHENVAPPDQHRRAVQAFNALQRDWDLNEEPIKLKLQAVFRSKAVVAQWDALLIEFASLYDEVHTLEDFAVTDKSEAHAKSIQRCRAQIEKTETALGKLNDEISRLVGNQLQ